MVRKKHKQGKKLHNFDEKLHNSDSKGDDEPELAWQETVDLLPEDEVEQSPEIYYFTDEDGNIHSREFLAEELVLDENEFKGALERKSSRKPQKLKPGAVDIVSLRAPDEPIQHVPLPAPKSGAPPLDIRISSEVVPELSPKRGSQHAAEKQVVIDLNSYNAPNGTVTGGPHHESGAPRTLYFTRAELDAYVAFRSEGMAKKSKDWINRSSEALWESTRGEISLTCIS